MCEREKEKVWREREGRGREGRGREGGEGQGREGQGGEGQGGGRLGRGKWKREKIVHTFSSVGELLTRVSSDTSDTGVEVPPRAGDMAGWMIPALSVVPLHSP